MAVKVELWGEYACFTRPEMKAERVSYDVITPSAARGIIEAIFYHPGMKWIIDRIYVLSPVKFTNIRRNEVTDKASAQKAKSAMEGKTARLPYLVTSEHIMQRAATVLQDVHYVIEAHFEMTDKANQTDNPAKFQEMTLRRLRKGQCYYQPYFGTREFPAKFCLWDKGEITSIPETKDLGYMLYDMDYSDPGNIQPMFFRANMVNGVIDLTDCKVIR
ncbi:MAG: type I-C CRISPR-associated protein Cas5c [Bulleidia sp.]|nr:type I-C CRISPR-associated protein Cas5c [Bulleidia sp.]